MHLTNVADIKNAERLAMIEAANTLGIVAPIHAVEVKSTKTTLIVGLPSSGRVTYRTAPASGRPMLGARSLGGSYIAPGIPNDGDVFGFVILRTPIHLIRTNDSWNEAEPCRLAIELPPTESLAPGVPSLGYAACAVCNGQISPGRLAAIPNARICTKCKKNQEIEQHERTVEHRRN
jgi:hypothetical protein